jgi:hypothetical protein
MAQLKKDDFKPRLLEQVKRHPNGHCRCLHAQQFIVRMYMGYGHCGFCGKLTAHLVRKR